MSSLHPQPFLGVIFPRNLFTAKIRSVAFDVPLVTNSKDKHAVKKLEKRLLLQVVINGNEEFDGLPADHEYEVFVKPSWVPLPTHMNHLDVSSKRVGEPD